MKKIILSLFFICFIIYTLNSNPVIRGDTAPARLLPFAILSGRGIYLDDFVRFFPGDPFFFQKYQGHTISSYPILAGLVAVPLYAPVYLYLRLTGNDSPITLFRYAGMLEKLSASTIAAGSVVLFFTLLYLLTKKKITSFLWALVFGLATPTYSISSQYLWQHGVANLFLLGSLISLVRAQRGREDRVWFGLLSIVCAILTVFARQTFIIYLILLTIFFLRSQTKYHWQYLVISLVGIIGFLLFNHTLYGSWFGTKSTPVSDFSATGFINGLLGLLASPSRGMLFYTPFFLIAFFLPLFKNRLEKIAKIEREILGLGYLFLVAIMMIYSSYQIWWGGWNWGDRYMTDGAVFFVLIISYLYGSVKQVFFRAIIIILIIYSFVTEFIGVWYYPRGLWDNYPVDVTSQESRLWDFTDTPINRNLVVGFDLSGIYRLYYRVSGLSEKRYTTKDRSCQLTLLKKDIRFGYPVADVLLTNTSTTDWVTASDHPITLHMFVRSNDQTTQLPLPSSPLPAVVGAGTGAHLTMPLILPKELSFDTLLIAPGQERVASWMGECRIEVSL